MVRPSTGEAKPWSGETDRRRCELIDKQIDGAASIEEAVELSELQTAFDRWIDSVAPLPLEPVRRLHDQLLSRVLADSLSDPRPE